MKHSNGQSLGSAIEAFFKAYHLEDKYNEMKLIKSWEKVVGKVIAKHTKDMVIRNKVLFVRVDSASLKQELNYQRVRLIEALNREAESQVINDIVFN